MKKKIIIFGGSSFIAKEVSKFLAYKYDIVSFSQKSVKIKNVKTIRTNYTTKSIIKNLDKIINKNNKAIFLFFNSLADKKIFIKNTEKEIFNILKVNQILPITLTNSILKRFFFNKPIFLYMSSSRAKGGDKGITLYSTTKNAISVFSHNMAMEYGKFGLIFKVILLGLFKGGLKNKLSKNNNKKILDRTFNNKYVEVEQLIKTLEFCFNDTASNGTEINCDNGYN